MKLDGIGINKESFSNFRVRQSFDGELENLFFTVGKNQFRLFSPSSSLERVEIPVSTCMV